MVKVAQPVPARTSHFMRRSMTYAAVLLIGFLLGSIPIGLKTLEYSNSLAATKHQFALSSIPNSLASAIIDARRGDYEPARQAVSDYFTALRSQTDNVNDSAFSQAQREALMPLLARRDELITLLARADPASADRLTDMYLAYRQITNK